MSHFHHWAKSQPDLLSMIRGGGCPALCGCDVCEQLYADCRQAVEKWLAEHDSRDFNEAERLKRFLSRQWLGSIHDTLPMKCTASVRFSEMKYPATDALGSTGSLRVKMRNTH
jgi:hypothetical protein